jgi:hypothetical protein
MSAFFLHPHPLLRASVLTAFTLRAVAEIPEAGNTDALLRELDFTARTV